jgi:2-iminobutanoate/2-iminopropanoate deaminase
MARRSAHRAAGSSPGAAGIRRERAIAGVPDPTGPFAWSVARGGLVFVSGVRGIDPATGAPAPDDARRIRLIFAHLARILAANGCAPGDVLSTRVYVTDLARHRPLVNEAFARFFGAALPTRTIVEVRALNQGDTVEVEVVASRNEA